MQASKPYCAGDGEFETSVKLKLSIANYQQRLETNKYSSEYARRSDLAQLAKCKAELALRSLCDFMHKDSAKTVKQAANLNFR